MRFRETFTPSFGGWVGQKKTKLMLYSTLVEIEVEVGVELGNRGAHAHKNRDHIYIWNFPCFNYLVYI